MLHLNDVKLRGVFGPKQCEVARLSNELISYSRIIELAACFSYTLLLQPPGQALRASPTLLLSRKIEMLISSSGISTALLGCDTATSCEVKDLALRPVLRTESLSRAQDSRGN